MNYLKTQNSKHDRIIFFNISQIFFHFANELLANVNNYKLDNFKILMLH